jgi:putative PIN family toxin of toxin-antitoxin system
MGTRVVLDTNVLISAFGWGGKPEQCLELVLDGDVEAYCTRSMLDELSRVLDYDRFDFSDDEKQSFLAIVTAAFHVTDTKVDVTRSDDADDDVFLECAVTVDADYVVSGDTHLLDLGSHDEIPILPPAAFLERVDAQSD